MTSTCKKAEFDKVEPQAKAAKKKEDELNAQAGGEHPVGQAYRRPLLLGAAARPTRPDRPARSADHPPRRGCHRRWPAPLLDLDRWPFRRPRPPQSGEEMRTAIVEQLSPLYKNVTSTFKISRRWDRDRAARWTAGGNRHVRHRRPTLHRRRKSNPSTAEENDETRQRRNSKDRPRRPALFRRSSTAISISCSARSQSTRKWPQRSVQHPHPGIANAKAEIEKTKQMEKDSPTATPAHAPGPGR